MFSVKQWSSDRAWLTERAIEFTTISSAYKWQLQFFLQTNQYCFCTVVSQMYRTQNQTLYDTFPNIKETWLNTIRKYTLCPVYKELGPSNRFQNSICPSRELYNGALYTMHRLDVIVVSTQIICRPSSHALEYILMRLPFYRINH